MATGKESIRAQTERILANAPGTRSLHGSQFNKIVIEPFVIPTGASQDFIYEFCCHGYAEAEALLNSLIEEPERRGYPDDERIELASPLRIEGSSVHRTAHRGQRQGSGWRARLSREERERSRCCMLQVHELQSTLLCGSQKRFSSILILKNLG